MEIDAREGHQRCVEHHRDPPGRVVEEREGRHRAGLDAEHLAQLLRGAEREPPRGSDRAVHPLEVDRRLVLGRDEEKAALLVLDEQVLGMRPRDAGFHGPRFGDREDRFVLDGLGGDPESAEIIQETLGSEVGHVDAPGWPWLLARRGGGLKQRCGGKRYRCENDPLAM
jgi:hypothetical protein